MNLDNLLGHIPPNVLAQIPNVMNSFHINTPLRLGHFLAQCGHESGGFTVRIENLNYSAEALFRVFRKYFPTMELAQEYARQPVRIGSRVYANRIGNGPENSWEGFIFRGRGYIQLTGKVNYKAFDKFVPENIITDPDLVAIKYPLLSAAWFWGSRNLNAIADEGDSDEVVGRVTRIVNGGYNGLPDRLARFHTYYPLLLI